MNIDITATDRASRVIKGVGTTADRTGRGISTMGVAAGSALGNLGAMAVAAGVSFAVDFGQKSVSAFTEAQASQVRFESSLQKNKVGSFTKQIDGLAQSLALKTRFDDDATKSGAAVLANFGLTGEQLTKTIPLVQDYAAFTGKDLTTASTVVGKAMLGNAKALKELGINFKPTGDKAKDLATIQDLLNQKVGGFAEKEGKSAAGQSQILANQFGELQEQVGSWLVPALQTLTGWLVTSVVPAVQKAAEWIGTNLGPVVAELGEWITGTAIPALQNMASAFMTNVWPAIQQVAGIIAENLQPVIEALQQFWTNTLQPAVAKIIPILGTVAKVIGIVVGALAIAISWIVGKVAPVFYGVLGPAIGFVIDVLGKIAGAVEWAIDHFGDLISFVKEIPGKIKTGLSTLLTIITTPFRLSFNAIASLWNNTVGKLSFKVPDWVPGIGGSGWDVPDIPMLAKGGIVTKPTLALVGEAGPEAVVPLSRGGMGQTVNVYVTQPLGTPTQVARAVSEALRKGGSGGTLAAGF